MAASSSAVVPAPPEGRELALRADDGRGVARQLVSLRGALKSSLARSLVELNQAGMLNTSVELNDRMLKRRFQEASEYHGKQTTPYGSVVQKLDLGHPQLPRWDVCHPLARMHYLSTLSHAFGDLMRQTCANRDSHIVIYVDECEPGNPFRPEKSRCLQCIYWCFSEWPAWLLKRTFAWPIFAIIRSSLVEVIDGGMSVIARVILRTFFCGPGDNFSRGVTLVHREGDFIVRSRFGGWLADLEGHRELTGWKGTSGNQCCLTCSNVSRRPKLHQVGLNCADPELFQRMTASDMFFIADYDTDGINLIKALRERATFSKVRVHCVSIASAGEV